MLNKFQNLLVEGGWISGARVGETEHECWFGRGDSGWLLGCFNNRHVAKGAVVKDNQAEAARVAEARAGAIQLEDDDAPVDLVLENRYSNEPDWPVLEVRFRKARSVYVIKGPNGFAYGYDRDPRDAANRAGALRAGYVRGL